MIEPGSATGTLLASADGEAIGGRPCGIASALSDLISSLEGFGLASMAWVFGAPGLATGVGEGDVFFSSSDGVLPFSSSASLPTSLDDDRATSFNAANTDAPPTVINVPPPETQSLRVV